MNKISVSPKGRGEDRKRKRGLITFVYVSQVSPITYCKNQKRKQK